MAGDRNAIDIYGSVFAFGNGIIDDVSSKIAGDVNIEARIDGNVIAIGDNAVAQLGGVWLNGSSDGGGNVNLDTSDGSLIPIGCDVAAQAGSIRLNRSSDGGDYRYRVRSFPEGSVSGSTDKSGHSIQFSYHNSIPDDKLEGLVSAMSRAAQAWQDVLVDDISVSIEVKWTPGFSNPAEDARATVHYVPVSYRDVYDALLDCVGSAENHAAGEALPAQAMKLLTNLTSDNPTGPDSTTPYVDGEGDDNKAMRVSLTNAKLLGLLPVDFPYHDGKVTVSGAPNWDFDPTDGIVPGQADCVAICLHEIGHVLGMNSLIDGRHAVDEGQPDAAYPCLTPFDLFSYSGASVAHRVPDWCSDARCKFFSVDAGVSGIADFSTDAVPQVLNASNGHRSAPIALAIGIDQYTSSLPSLNYAVSDSKKIAHIMSLYQYQAFSLNGDGMGQNSFLQNVAHCVESHVNARELLVYYAGHGTADRFGNRYFVLSGGSTISVSTFLRYLKTLSPKVTLITDCCFDQSDALNIKSIAPPDIPKNVNWIKSVEYGKSYESHSIGGGVFTDRLINRLASEYFARMDTRLPEID